MIFRKDRKILIKSARKRHNITQKQLANKTGLSQGYISKLENRNIKLHSPTIRQIVRISSVLDINVLDLCSYFVTAELLLDKSSIFEYATELGGIS